MQLAAAQLRRLGEEHALMGKSEQSLAQRLAGVVPRLYRWVLRG